MEIDFSPQGVLRLFPCGKWPRGVVKTMRIPRESEWLLSILENP
jgi:hypothetical protein